MKNWLRALSLVGLLGCSHDPTVLVTVDAIPSLGASLQVIPTHGGFAAAKPIDPYDISMLSMKGSATFLLKLPAGFAGDFGASVAVYDKPNATGCLLASGSGKSDMFMGPDDVLRISLNSVNDPGCTGKQPLLLGASPSLGKTSGNEMVTLNGWGFHPDSLVTMGTKPAQATFLSASQLMVTTPANAGFGPTLIRVANKDGNNDSRKDIFSFYSDVLSFTTIPLSNSVAFNDLAGFAIGHFNPLSMLDLALTLPTQNQVRIEFTTAGNVTDSKKINVGNAPGPIVSADFDKDGDPDVLISNTADSTLQLLTNDGMGVFTAQTAFAVGTTMNSLPIALITGDLNGDGAPDAVIALKNDDQLQVLLNKNDGSGTFTLGTPLDVGSQPVGISIGDVNGDGKPDIAVANQGESPMGSGIYKVTVVFNQGNGAFDDASGHTNSLPVCKQPTSIFVTDTDGNGTQDVIMSCTGDNKIRVIQNMGFPNIAIYDLPTEPMPRNMALVDLNGDNFKDIVVPSQAANKIDIFLNKLGMGFQNVSFISLDAQCPSPYQVAAIDVDNDQKADLGVAGNGASMMGCLSVLFNQSK